ncbi:GH3 domain-containing protein [Amphibalanus amphitrite]|nr:GH3 domain-containing protein [Amphibalanus amphitrite]
MVKQYATQKLLAFVARYMRRRFDRDTKHFMKKDGREHTQFLYSSPPAANDIPAEPAAVYVHLLFGLRDRELGAIEANFASFVYSVFSALERDWQRLARDLAAGRLGKDVEVPDSVRTACDAALSPEPARAAELREIFESEDAFRDGRLARRVWPHLNFITTVTSGAMQLYAARLQRRYTGQVPLYSALYAATEGLLGVNLWPEESQPRYVLHPRAMLFEFGETAGTDGDKILLASELEVGGEYELIVTNRSGMFRFRMGDVVRVVDFYNGAPIVEFLYRKGQLLDVHSEKMSEAAFFGALRSAADGWSSTLVDYTTAESVLLAGAADNPPHYVVLLELNGAPLTDDERQKVDESLCAHHEVYRSFRCQGGHRDLPRWCASDRAAFERLRQHVLANSDTSALQFKVPRVLRTESLLQLMLEGATP